MRLRLPGEIRKAGRDSCSYARSRGIHELTFAIDPQFAEPLFVQAAVEGAICGDFEPDHLKSDPKRHDKRIDTFTVLLPQADASLEKAAETGRIIAESQNFARELVNLPANLLRQWFLRSGRGPWPARLGSNAKCSRPRRCSVSGMGSLLGRCSGQ